MVLRLAIRDSIDKIDEAQWNACAGEDVLLQHAFFRTLEHSGAVGRGRTILPQYVLLLDDGGNLQACAPAMLKAGTLVEYGPECRWLRAGLAEGCFSWPKFQVGLPLYAVRGPRLMVRPGAESGKLRALLIDSMKQLAVQHYERSAFNLMHIEGSLAKQLESEGWLISHEIHSFWHNDGWRDFPDYLDSLPHRKRYLILNERQKTANLGLDFRFFSGEEITPALLAAYYAGHQEVCERHGNRPWLPADTLQRQVEEMPEAIRLIAAFSGDQYVAGAIWIVAGDTLILRTWSAFQELPGLCFELICHRPVVYAIENGLKSIDTGLHGAHKRLRGFADERVFNAHWFADENLRQLATRVLAVVPPV